MANNQINLSFLKDFIQECDNYKLAQLQAEEAHYQFTIAQYKYQNGYIGMEEYNRVRQVWRSSVDKMRQMLTANNHSVSIKY